MAASSKGDLGVGRLPVPVDTPPMEAQAADDLPHRAGWQFEPKWDGFRCLVFKEEGQVELRAKSGKSLTRYFPEVARAFAENGPDRFILDGELVIRQVAASLSMRCRCDCTRQKVAFESFRLNLLPCSSPSIVWSIRKVNRFWKNRSIAAAGLSRTSVSPRAQSRTSVFLRSRTIAGKRCGGSAAPEGRSTASSPSGSAMPTSPARAPW